VTKKKGKKEDTMASSDEAIAKAREFANRVGWFTPTVLTKVERLLQIL